MDDARGQLFFLKERCSFIAIVSNKELCSIRARNTLYSLEACRRSSSTNDLVLEEAPPRKNGKLGYTAGSCPDSVLLVEVMQQLYGRLSTFSALLTEITKHYTGGCLHSVPY
jgi:hypothetical protein